MQHLAPKCPWFRRGTKIRLFEYAFAGALVLSGAALHAGEKWKMQYFYDKDDASLTFTDIACASTKRCVATGVIEDGKHDRGALVTTSDGGANWDLEPLKEHPISVFFLKDGTGWMVTDRGIWQSEETGKDWKKVKDQKGLERICFIDDNHGWAVGAPKLVLQTDDGGHKWSPVAEAQKAPTAPDNTVYHWITFPTVQQGLIVGSWTLPHNRQELPDWMNPERAKYRHEYPSVTILLQTLDGGKKWTELSRRSEGLLTRFRFGSADYGLALLDFPSSADVASELVKMDLKTNQNMVAYANPSRMVRDFAILPGGDSIIATTERVGKANALPIPGKLRMMRSSSLKTWIDMDVDYRAVAGQATIAAADSRNVWVATDTGMILKLE